MYSFKSVESEWKKQTASINEIDDTYDSCVENLILIWRIEEYVISEYYSELTLTEEIIE